MATKKLVAYKDTSFNSNSPDSNYYGTFQNIFCGVINTVSVKSRMAIGFPIDQIPAGSQITGATLYFYKDDDITYLSDLVFDLYRITGAWDESTATWNNPPAIEETPTIAGLVCEATGVNAWKSYDITTLFAEMFANGNDSILFRAQNESAVNSSRSIFTREWSTDYCAYIDVTYIPPAKIAASQGAINKSIIAMKIAPVEGLINKTILGAKIAPQQGAINKTIF